ncbi:MAG: hypothetical protein ABL958_06060 [Bdellovibrionia bacterium]
MARKITGKFLVALLVFAFALPVHAQSEGASLKTGGPRRQVALIIFAGLGGAILGLSTLSFYGRPQDKLSNIAIGFALGIIGGTIFVTYKAAADPKDFYNTSMGESILQKRQTLLEPPSDYALNYRYTF